MINYVIVIATIVASFILGRLGRREVDDENLHSIANSIAGINKVIQKWEQVRRNDRIAELNKQEENSNNK